LLNIKSKPAPDALTQQLTQLREVVFGLCAHLPADDPNRAVAIERLKAVEALMQDPLEWHILSRAQELRQDATDPKLRAQLEASFYEENVPRTVWQSMSTEGQSELRKSLRLPMWIDVELDSQTLTVHRGAVPQFATLVSTGFKGPTPKGIFRISMKHTLGQMRSRPDSDEPYTVEAVPFIQYFTGNFALHGAFWHYRFGHKISHGCVNLAPNDARRIFGLTTPHVRRGWQSSYESESHLGTTVRVRKGDEPVVDKRTTVQPLEG